MLQRLICHIDMNSFFASVEQQANPFLRGRALGVCAYLHRSGCVIAASVEAKRQGMKVGMSMEEALAAVPGAVFVENDPAKYRSVSSRVFAILHELTDTVEHYSIDEVFLDLTGWYRDAAEAAFALSRVKHRIRTEVGEWLRASVGIAPTRFLSKFASERQKPDGLTVITRENLDELLAAAPLQEACGIGPRIGRRLERLGMKTLLDLKHYPVGNLMRFFSKNGYYLWAHVNGIECERVLDEEPLPKSVGHSYCVPNRVNREGKVEAVLAKLTERAGRRLRACGLLAHGMTVTVGLRRGAHRAVSWWQGDDTVSELVRFPEPADDSFTLVRQGTRLLRKLWHGEPVDFLAVTLVELTPPTNQLCLPVGVDRDRSVQAWEKRQAASRSLDQIRDRYGDAAIVLGKMAPLIGTDEAPDRIGYRKTVGVEVRPHKDAELVAD